ncbi:hypothetical protein HMPREF1004_00208 [Ralstonia pickettii]|nr:hypothetical protein HMPREF1004_00208 [Ralstonia pickettii]
MTRAMVLCNRYARLTKPCPIAVYRKLARHRPGRVPHTRAPHRTLSVQTRFGMVRHSKCVGRRQGRPAHLVHDR